MLGTHIPETVVMGPAFAGTTIHERVARIERSEIRETVVTAERAVPFAIDPDVAVAR
jgi:hypothetical protein